MHLIEDFSPNLVWILIMVIFMIIGVRDVVRINGKVVKKLKEKGDASGKITSIIKKKRALPLVDQRIQMLREMLRAFQLVDHQLQPVDQRLGRLWKLLELLQPVQLIDQTNAKQEQYTGSQQTDSLKPFN